LQNDKPRFVFDFIITQTFKVTSSGGLLEISLPAAHELDSTAIGLRCMLKLGRIDLGVYRVSISCRVPSIKTV